VPWPPLVTKFTKIFYALSFNIEIAHPECSVDVNFYDKLKMVVLAPVGIAVLLVLFSKFLNYQRARYEQQEDIVSVRYYRKKWKLLRQLIVIFVTSVYTPVMYYSLRMFEPCVETPGGLFVMAGDTSIECFDSAGAYAGHTTFAWGALLLFGVGIPLGIVVLVVSLKRRHLLNSGDTLLRYGALYEWYNDDFAWFEAVSLTRKGAMLLPVTLLSDPIPQAMGMMCITLVYAMVIVVFKPFIRFPLRLRVVKKEVDFYNFIETVTAVATGSFSSPLPPSKYSLTPHRVSLQVSTCSWALFPLWTPRRKLRARSASCSFWSTPPWFCWPSPPSKQDCARAGRRRRRGTRSRGSKPSLKLLRFPRGGGGGCWGRKACR